ncbi:MAG: PepSY-like domain-containing protein [Bacteroidales bacterium]
MKKNLLLLALAASAFTMQSCEKDDDVTTVPAAVAESFSAKYPKATRVSWEYEDGYLIADFYNENNQEAEAWFDHKGVWYLTETDISFTYLPTAVKDAFGASKYAAWKIDDVDMVERANQDLFYVIEVESGKLEYDLYYDADGTLTKEEIDSNKEHEYLP